MAEQVGKVQSHINENNGSWDDLWKKSCTPWDLGEPTPVLIKELEKERSHLASEEPTSLRSFVPGCGTGYDLSTLMDHHTRILSSLNKDRIDSVIVGLDISPASLKEAKAYLDASGYADGATTRLQLKCGDFFAEEWDTVYSSSPTTMEDVLFDFVFDYTFFCALLPEQRAAWGKRMASLLRPNSGRLLTLIFPILPNAEMRGPPYPVTVADYQQALTPHGVTMVSEPFQSPFTVPSRQGKELVCYWKRNLISEP